MTTAKLYIRHIIFICLLAGGLKTHAQESKITWAIDSSLFTKIILSSFFPGFSYIYHTPDKKDRERYRRYKSLITQQPTKKNHELYYSLACSLWELEKTAEAEKMFLAIMNSKERYYDDTYYHSSDIPGDKTTNIYGYGSYTSNYKNYAVVYLAKIYIEQKQFDKALRYVDDAVNIYRISYSCGTAYISQQNEYDFLYASCYAGLKMHKELINLLLPGCLERDDEMIIASIKNTYTPKEIQEYLQKAESSMVCSLDSFPSISDQADFSASKREKADTITNYTGSATITLFEREIEIPFPLLQKGEYMTKERFIKRFKESFFYTKLIDPS